MFCVLDGYKGVSLGDLGTPWLSDELSALRSGPRSTTLIREVLSLYFGVETHRECLLIMQVSGLLSA